ITYALRPEKLLVTTEQPTCEYNWSRGKIHDIAYLGGHADVAVGQVADVLGGMEVSDVGAHRHQLGLGLLVV
ncbi:TOBE domain-containing protein, partial [Pseudomonas otitidis]